MPVTYPGGGPRITVEALLKQPQFLARRLTDLVNKRFVADRIFSRGTAQQVTGGAVVYQKSESIYPTNSVEEVGVRSRYPRTGWTEALYAAYVKKYGLEVPIADEAKRRNALDQVERAQRKLSNAVVKFVDKLAMDLLIADTDVLTFGAAGDWSTAATDIIADIAKAKGQIADQEEGYEADVLIVNPAQELDLMVDKDIRDAMPRESSSSTVQTGRVMPLMGLDAILTTSQLSAGTAFVLNSKIVGTIADEAPMPDENYSSYNPGGGAASIYVKVYREEGADESIVRAARFPAMWIAEPKAAVKITGA